MKLIKSKEFKPVSLTLETREEFDVFYQLANNSSRIAGKLKDIEDKVKDIDVDGILTKLWDILGDSQ